MNKLVLLKLVRNARDALASGKGVDYVMEKINEIEDYLAEPEAKTMEDLLKDYGKFNEMFAIHQERFIDRIKELQKNITKNV